MTARRACGVAAACAVGWWLFADTVAHYAGSSQRAGVIRFAHYGNYQDQMVWQRVIQAFQAAHPQSRIEQEYIPGFGTDYDNKLHRQLLAGIAPEVFMVQDESFAHYARQSLADLSGLIDPLVIAELRSNFHPTAGASFTFDERTHGWPLYGGSLLIYVNLQCLRKAAAAHQADEDMGIDSLELHDDWTIEEFRDLCRVLTIDFDGDGRTDQYGLWHPWWGYYLPVLWSMGAEVLDQTRTRWRLQGTEAVRAVRLYHDLLRVDRVCPPPGEFGQMRQDIAFLTGRVAMVINGPWFIPMLEQSGLRDDYRIMHIPRGRNGRVTRVTWDGIAINRNINAQARELAAHFLLFTAGQQAQTLFAESGRVVPARLDVEPASTIGADSKGIEKFIESFSYMRLQPITPHWKQMNRAIGRHLRSLLAGRRSAEQCLESLASDPEISSHFDMP